MPSGSAYQSLIIPPPKRSAPPRVISQAPTLPPIIRAQAPPASSYRAQSQAAAYSAPHGAYSNAGTPAYQAPVAGGNMSHFTGGGSQAPSQPSPAQLQADAFSRIQRVVKLAGGSGSPFYSLKSAPANPFDLPQASGKQAEQQIVDWLAKGGKGKFTGVGTKDPFTGTKPATSTDVTKALQRIGGVTQFAGALSQVAKAGASKAPWQAIAQLNKPVLPSKVADMVKFANAQVGKPYIYGSGHGGWGPMTGYDCSGFVSAVLHAGGYLTAPVDTTAMPSQIGLAPGPGKYVTVYDRSQPGMSGHVIINLNGQFYEAGGSSGAAGGNGGGGVVKMTPPSASYLATFDKILHPLGIGTGGGGKATGQAGQVQTAVKQLAAGTRKAAGLPPAQQAQPGQPSVQVKTSPLAPLLAKAGPTSSGKISFFGGSTDPTAGNQTASGAPISEPGIALYNQSTLGGYYLVRMPNGKQAVLKQTDIGPAPWTGRKVDFTYSSLPALGYSTGNFPTDASITYRYLGKSVPSNVQGLVSAGAAAFSGSGGGGATGGGGGTVAASGGGGGGGGSVAVSAPAAGGSTADQTAAALGTTNAVAGTTGTQTAQQQAQQQLLSSLLKVPGGAVNPWNVGASTVGLSGGTSMPVGALPPASQLPGLALSSLQSLAGNIKLKKIKF